MTGDESSADAHLRSFPFMEEGDTPESAVAKLAELCRKKTGMFPGVLDL